jgi:hypothetical protein
MGEDENDWATERRFLWAVAKLAISLASGVACFFLLYSHAPKWLVQFICLAIMLWGFDWALRGTSFDPHARRDREKSKDE